MQPIELRHTLQVRLSRDALPRGGSEIARTIFSQLLETPLSPPTRPTAAPRKELWIAFTREDAEPFDFEEVDVYSFGQLWYEKVSAHLPGEPLLQNLQGTIQDMLIQLFEGSSAVMPQKDSYLLRLVGQMA